MCITFKLHLIHIAHSAQIYKIYSTSFILELLIFKDIYIFSLTKSFIETSIYKIIYHFYQDSRNIKKVTNPTLIN